MSSIVVLGSLHMDVLVNAPDRPRKGETLAGTRWWLQAGGKGGNQAAQAARLGAQVDLIGRVGADDFGGKLLDALQQAGVRTQFVRVDDTAGSGMSIAIIDQQGDYGAVIVSGVNQHIQEDDLNAAEGVLRQAGLLVLQHEIALATNWEAARRARRLGVPVLLNAAPAYPLDAETLSLIDILVVNEVEAEMLSGLAVRQQDDVRAAADKLLASAPVVIITLGGRGVWAARRGQDPLHLPAYPVRVVDTHGAGDSFIGALAARLAAGDSLDAALRLANAAGAFTCTHAGPQSDTLNLEALRTFMRAGA